jgi:hypothetical protein
MCRLLVIPDLHGRKFWREAIANNIGQVDKVIFLGDYLDPYMKEIEEDTDSMECNDFYDCYNLMNMLNDIISLKKNEPNKYILLTGNHTDSYIWSNFHAATRTDYKNWEKYHKFFSQNLEYFNLVWTKDNCIFSHAGISEGWAKAVAVELSLTINLNNPVKSIAKYLSNVDLNNILDKKLIKLLGNISHYRWGENNYGSCEWADIREHMDMQKSLKQKDFIPIGEDGIFQVFGHTQLKTNIVTDKWACLDCRKGFIFDTLTHECISCL